MAAYATVADVQARFPSQIIETFSDSSPITESQVSLWLDQQSDWVDRTLAWNYVVPITDSDDTAALNPIVADLVAAQVCQFRDSYDNKESFGYSSFRKQALSSLAYDQKTGRSMIALSNSSSASSGEANRSAPTSSFTDPDADGSNPRVFKVSMDL